MKFNAWIQFVLTASYPILQNTQFNQFQTESANFSRDKDKSRPERREDWSRLIKSIESLRSRRSRAFQCRRPCNISGASPARSARLTSNQSFSRERLASAFTRFELNPRT